MLVEQVILKLLQKSWSTNRILISKFDRINAVPCIMYETWSYSREIQMLMSTKTSHSKMNYARLSFCIYICTLMASPNELSCLLWRWESNCDLLVRVLASARLLGYSLMCWYLFRSFIYRSRYRRVSMSFLISRNEFNIRGFVFEYLLSSCRFERSFKDYGIPLQPKLNSGEGCYECVYKDPRI